VHCKVNSKLQSSDKRPGIIHSAFHFELPRGSDFRSLGPKSLFRKAWIYLET